jgi:hypothetical protein
MDQIVQLHSVDPSLFSEISSDLLEPTIRLQILLAPKLAKSLTQLSIHIATHSRALDFQRELGNIIALLKSSENSHPFEIFKNSQGKESKDSFKTVVTFYVPIILRMVEDEEVLSSMEKMMEVVDFIRFEINEYHAVLGTDIVHEICAVLVEKKNVLKALAKKETLRFLMELLDVYIGIGIFKQYRKEVVNTVVEIFGDFSLILKVFNSSGFGLYQALTVLAIKTVKAANFHLSLPSPLSGKSRFLILAPAGLISENLMVQKRILNHCNFYCEQEVDPYKITTFYPQFTPSSVILKGLESMTSADHEVKRLKLAFKNLFFKFSQKERFRFLPHLVLKSKNEVVCSFLIRVMAQSDNDGKFLRVMMKVAVGFTPVIDYFMCFAGISKYLEGIKGNISAKEIGFELELRDVYDELVGKLNVDEEKRKRIIQQFQRLFNN